MNDITKQLADALRKAEDRLGVLIECDNESALQGASPDDTAAFLAAKEALEAFDAAQTAGCKPYRDSVFYVVATWHGERQIWREGVFDSAEDAANAFASYVEDYLASIPGTPAFNPEIHELEV